MATTKEDIKRWLKSAVKNKATHMMVVTDTFDYSDYPIEVNSNQDVRDVYNKLHQRNMQKVMEVYNLSDDLKAQLNSGRAFNFGPMDLTEFKDPFLK